MTNAAPFVIDSHHHLLDPDAADYPWMTGDYERLHRASGPDDLTPLLEATGVAGTIVVQARQELNETHYLLNIAARTDWIMGVVGWVDLTSPDVAETISNICEGRHGERLVGIRHLAHDEADPEWLLRDDVMRGLAGVAEVGLTYDLLVRPRELGAATQVARRLPGLRFVLDHLAKPPIASGELEPWASLIGEIAKLPNVSCKVSGLVTEADWASWEPADLSPYIAAALEMFGADRLMYGSDWPVCTLAASYNEVLEATTEILSRLTGAEVESVLGLNAATTYGIDPSSLVSDDGR